MPKDDIPSVGGYSKGQCEVAWIVFQTLTTKYNASEGIAAGIIGNAEAECGLNPGAQEVDAGYLELGASAGGWGLFQITNTPGNEDAKQRAWAWMDDHGGRGPVQQVVYAIDVETGRMVKKSDLKKDKTPEEGANYWYNHYEYPGDYTYGFGQSPRMDIGSQHKDRRYGAARKFYSAFKGRGGEGLSDELKEKTKFDMAGGGGDEGPDYVSFEEALIEGFKGGKKEKPQGIAIHEILGYTSAKAAKDALHKKQTIGQGGAQFHIVCDAKDAYMVVDLEKRVSHVQRTSGGKNSTGISNPDAKTISIGMCGSSGAVMGKAAQVAAEVCHLLDLDANTINGSFKFDGLKDPASWEAQENNSIIGPNGNFINMVMQQGAAAAGAADIGGINSSTGGGGGGGRGSTAKAIKVAEEWHAMNDKCYYSMGAARRKGPHTGGVDCSHFVMGCFAGAGYNVQIGSTVWMLQNCKPLEGEKNSDQCRGGKNAFFKQIPPNEARKGDVLVAGGLGGAGAGGHTGMVWEKYHGRETKFMNSGGCSAEGRAQPNLSSIGCAMGNMGLWVFMTVNSNDSDEPEEDEESTESKEKEKKNKVVKKK